MRSYFRFFQGFSLTMKRRKSAASRLENILKSCESLEETNTTQLVKRDGEETMSIEPRLVQFEVREIESARRKIRAFEENCRKRHLTELKRTKRRYEREMDEARQDLTHRERRLEARAAHYEQMYGGVVEEAMELENIVARELEYRHTGENTIREMEDAMKKQKDICIKVK